jgi:hypothetical protein
MRCLIFSLYIFVEKSKPQTEYSPVYYEPEMIQIPNLGENAFIDCIYGTHLTSVKTADFFFFFSVSDSLHHVTCAVNLRSDHNSS